MKAIRYHAYGVPTTVARLEDVPTPKPRSNEVLVRIQFASINPMQWKLMAGHLRWIVKDRPPSGCGDDFAGIVVGHGSDVKAPPMRTPVVGMLNPFRRTSGALAEYVAVAAHEFVAVPAAMQLSVACACPVAGLSAKTMLQLARVGLGQRILVNGAAGGIGSFAVQMVRNVGSTVVATGRAENHDYLRSLGADEVIDYRVKPVTEWLGPFDAVLDCPTTLSRGLAAQLLKPRGIHVTGVPPSLAALFMDPLMNSVSKIQRRTLMLKPSMEDLKDLIADVVAGRIRPAIGREYSLADAVKALEESRGGHARGKLIVRVARDA